MPIFYKSGYKYQLVKDYSIETVIVGSLMDLDFLKLTPNGVLTIRDGYAWDGPSGPVIDSPDTMRASLVHDAVYQLLRSGLDAKWKNAADELLYRLCIEDGMNILTAKLIWQGVQWFGRPFTQPSHEAAIISAGKR